MKTNINLLLLQSIWYYQRIPLFIVFIFQLIIPCNHVSGQAVTGKTIVVAPGGSDNNPGTMSRPLATVTAARDAARKAGPGNNRIIIRPGEYYLFSPLELDSRDNGLTIEADTSGKVIIYGGVPVTGWKRDGGKFWYVDLPGVKEGTWDFRALVVNGRMPERARMPESGTFLHKSVFDVPLIQRIGWGRQPTQDELTRMLYDPKDIPESLDIKNAEIRVYNMWTESLLGVASNDIQHHELTFKTPALFAMGAFGRKDYVIWNTREGMTKPGRWYLDRTAGRLVYWPLEGEDMSRAKIIAPKMERIIHIAGEPDKKAENITIRGLSFQATTTPLLQAGLRAHEFDGALSMINTHQCTLERLEISNAGGIGIVATQMTDCKISECNIHNMGGGGARINGVDILFARNYIHDAGIYYPSAVGLYVRGGNHYHIYRNEIHDVTYSGMNIYSDDVLVEENLIYRVMRELHDGAAIYIAGTGNCILRGNVARDISAAGTGFGISSYYLDEGCHDCVIEKNISINVSRPVHNHIARNSIIRDNVFINPEDMTLSFQSSARFTFEGNTLITPGKILMVSPNAVTRWKGNKIFSGGSNKGDILQAYKIDSAMPLFPIPAHKTRPVEVIRSAKAPVLDGELKANEWAGEYYRLDREPSRFPYSGAPVIVKFSSDNKFLYIGGMMMMFDTINISKGDRWGKDDGVEISIGGFDKGKPVTYVIRSYVNGTMQSLTDAGATAAAAERLGKGVRYVSRIMAKPTNGWTGEWAIPLNLLGLKPGSGQKIAFNICAFINEYDKWHCWEGTQGENWEVDKAGILQFR